MIVFLIACLSHLPSTASDSSQTVTIVKKNVKVIEVLLEIENQTGLKFFFSNNEVDTERKVTLSWEGVPLDKALDTLFAKTPITYKFSENYIILVNRKTSKSSIISRIEPDGAVFAANADTGVMEKSLYDAIAIKVSGKVTSQTLEPIPGVNIMEKGTTTGSVTDVDGNFTINVSQESAVLVFSFIGFQNYEISLHGKTAIDVMMQPDVKILSEVVVIGYGVQKKKDLTGAVGSISGKDISQLPVTNGEQAMQGKLAGVTVTQSASPGGNVSVRIRGIGTIGDNEPLFIVDGVQTTGGLNTINPGDIESIDVLKDASAAAIYGLRAANGVVMVTTKRGLRNTKTKVDFAAYTGVQQRWKKVDVIGAKDYVRVITEAQQNANAQRAELGSGLLSPLPVDFTVDNVESITDWQDKVFRSGVIQNYQLGISGGNETTNFSVSGSFRDEQGIIIIPGSSDIRFVQTLITTHLTG